MTTEPGDAIPRNYEEWKYCIEHWCGLELSPTFIDTRIKALNDRSDEHTQRIIESYGQAHHRALLTWFERARDSVHQP